jgi:E3 SUMO-protein ligase PIAS1
VKAAAQDADIVPGAETLTLKDPISMTRIELPCKSRYCLHTACFDAATFLTLNEQTPTWTCPICNRAIPTDDDLFLDGYVIYEFADDVDISMIFSNVPTRR